MLEKEMKESLEITSLNFLTVYFISNLPTPTVMNTCKKLIFLSCISYSVLA